MRKQAPQAALRSCSFVVALLFPSSDVIAVRSTGDRHHGRHCSLAVVVVVVVVVVLCRPQFRCLLPSPSFACPSSSIPFSYSPPCSSSSSCYAVLTLLAPSPSPFLVFSCNCCRLLSCLSFPARFLLLLFAAGCRSGFLTSSDFLLLLVFAPPYSFVCW